MMMKSREEGTAHAEKVVQKEGATGHACDRTQAKTTMFSRLGLSPWRRYGDTRRAVDDGFSVWTCESTLSSILKR